MLRVASQVLTVVLFTMVTWAYGAEDEHYQWSKVRKGEKEQANTWAEGTNDSGWIVGNYIWRTEPFEGGAFRFKDNKFHEFTLPGAENVLHVNINDIGKSSTIIGTYTLPSTGDSEREWTLHSFLYRHSLNDYISIDVPGAFWTFPFAMNDKRQVGIGYFADAGLDLTTWGAVVYDYATNTFTPVTVFGHHVVTIGGINNHGDLTGNVEVPLDGSCECQITHYGFVRIAGEDHLLFPPEWALTIRPLGINDDGVVIGSALIADGWEVGFRVDLTTGVWEQIRHPNLKDGWHTRLTDIDNHGRMTAIVTRDDDDYTEGWWIRPKSKVASK
jgi:hypothetical protein